jgi:hypothetical protein
MGLLAVYVLQRLPKRQPVPEAAKTDYVVTAQGSSALVKLDPRGPDPSPDDAVSDKV